MLVHNKDVT